MAAGRFFSAGGLSVNEFLTIHEALHRLRANYGDLAPSYPMFYRAVLDGRVPGVRVRSGWRIPPDLEAIRVACACRRWQWRPKTTPIRKGNGALSLAEPGAVSKQMTTEYTPSDVGPQAYSSKIPRVVALAGLSLSRY